MVEKGSAPEFPDGLGQILSTPSASRILPGSRMLVMNYQLSGHIGGTMGTGDENIFNAVDKTLLLELGNELLSDGMASAPTSANYKLTVAIGWLASRHGKIQQALCPHAPRIRKLLEEDSTTAMTAIADLIAGLCVGVSPFTVGKICVQLGLKRICVGFGLND